MSSWNERFSGLSRHALAATSPGWRSHRVLLLRRPRPAVRRRCQRHAHRCGPHSSRQERSRRAELIAQDAWLEDQLRSGTGDALGPAFTHQAATGPGAARWQVGLLGLVVLTAPLPTRFVDWFAGQPERIRRCWKRSPGWHAVGAAGRRARRAAPHPPRRAVGGARPGPRGAGRKEEACAADRDHLYRALTLQTQWTGDLATAAESVSARDPVPRVALR